LRKKTAAAGQTAEEVLKKPCLKGGLVKMTRYPEGGTLWWENYRRKNCDNISQKKNKEGRGGAVKEKKVHGMVGGGTR